MSGIDFDPEALNIQFSKGQLIELARQFVERKYRVEYHSDPELRMARFGVLAEFCSSLFDPMLAIEELEQFGAEPGGG